MNNSPDFKYIDTHVHLYDEAFDIDFDETLARIRQSGVGCCIFPAIDKESWPRQSECAEKCRGFAFEAIGLHPTSVGANWMEELEFVKEKLFERNSGAVENGSGYVAVGEIGIDGYWSKEFIEQQKIVFREQLLLAKEYGLPVIVHVRDAMDSVFEV